MALYIERAAARSRPLVIVALLAFMREFTVVPPWRPATGKACMELHARRAKSPTMKASVTPDRPPSTGPMNGAEALIRTLVTGGVDVCFANPGTSEMHFVAALDRVPEMRCVLALFEGVATGAADGYARMADRPASTLLHLGPGFANGMANLHNA